MTGNGVRPWIAGAIVCSALMVACGGGGSGGSATGSSAEPNYFPLGATDLWAYSTTPGSGVTVARVSGTQSVAGRTGAVVLSSDNNGMPRESIYLAGADGVREAPSADADLFSKAIGTIELIRLPIVPGASFVQLDKTVDSGVDFDGDRRNDPVAIRSVVSVIGLERVSTPAGTFDGSLHQQTVVSYIVNYSSGGNSVAVTITSDDWYAPEIGPVRSVVSTRSGPYVDTTTETLRAYRVGARRSETEAPTLQSMTPAAGSLAVSGSSVSATFSEPMDLAALNSGGFVVLDAAGQLMAGRVTLAGETARFEPVGAWKSGSYTARISSAAQDLLGNAFVGERTWRFTLDATSPAIVGTVPADASVDVALDSAIVLRFSEPVDPATVNAGTVSVTSRGASLPVNISVAGSTATLTPRSPLPRGQDVSVQISPAFSDLAGNPLGQTFQIGFRTEAGRFGFPSALAPGLTTDAMAVGDVNGDGINDVVFTTSTASTPQDQFALFVRLGRSDGTLAAPTRVNTGPALACWASAVVIGDIDGDGRNDVVVGGNGCGAQVFHQAADGRLVATQFLDRAAMAALRIADLDGDGRLDLVGVAGNGNTVNVYRQNASGVLVLQASPALNATGARDIALGDVNGDGRVDIVVTINGGFVGQNVGVLLQQPDGSFAAPVFMSADPSWGVAGVAIADLNGDGRNDVVAVGGGNSPTVISVYYQRADGMLAPCVAISSYDIPLAVRAADIDGDGRADIVVSHQGWLKVGVYLQRPDGSLAGEELFAAPYGNGNTQSLAIGDVTGDGRPDIVLAGELLAQRSTPATAAETRMRSSATRQFPKALRTLAWPQGAMTH